MMPLRVFDGVCDRRVDEGHAEPADRVSAVVRDRDYSDNLARPRRGHAVLVQTGAASAFGIAWSGTLGMDGVRRCV